MSRVSRSLLVVVALLTIAAGTALAAENPQPLQANPTHSKGATSGQSVVAPTDVSDPLAGKTITFTDSKKDKDSFYNTFSIAASNCTVSTDASITLTDTDGTEVTIPNQKGFASISATSTTVKGKGTSDRHHNIGFDILNPGDGALDQNSTVESSSGITCT